MYSNEIFAKIINAVSLETEINCETLLSDSKETEIVDARSILIYLLFEKGLYPSTISKLIRKTQASVRYSLQQFENRKKSNKIVEINLQRIRKSIENK